MATENSSRGDSSRRSPEDKRASGRRWELILIGLLVLAGLGLWAWVQRATIASWLGIGGPPEVTMRETYEEQPDGKSFDHAALRELLEEHVDEGGWVDYQSLQGDGEKLDDYLDSLAEAPFDELGRDEKLALLINAYNAFTLRLILDHYPLESIMEIPAAERWEEPRWEVAGRTVTINEIEHEWIRPNFKEPRIHFALVCAAAGCPPLRREPYRGAAVDAQLEDQTETFFGEGRWFDFQADGSVHVSELMKWYRDDFEQVAESLPAYMARYSPGVKRALDAGNSPEIQWIPYDWSLNDVKRR